jgi:hypothetical protein
MIGGVFAAEGFGPNPGFQSISEAVHAIAVSMTLFVAAIAWLSLVGGIAWRVFDGKPFLRSAATIGLLLVLKASLLIAVFVIAFAVYQTAGQMLGGWQSGWRAGGMGAIVGALMGSPASLVVAWMRLGRLLRRPL